MPTAMWKNKIIAEAAENDVITLEGNVYFPPQYVDQQYLAHSDKHTICPWKGTASYYDIVVDNQINAGAAWTYLEPKEAAKKIAGYIAFWRGVTIVA
ncbi:DUF427 domain-containing protein [Undibacterium sp. MH2W]|uniref:DUF427 domain-containing protein n=1 Tax=Undibacterium sp. MH2W TaxID=3413044 RepID=UPI003BF38447